MTEIAISATDGDALAEQVVDAAARQILTRYVYDEDGDEARVPSELHRRIEQKVVSVIEEQAREAAPIVAAEILEQGVQQSDTWGEPRGGVKPLKVVVAEEVKKNLQHGSGRRGEGVLDRLIREEVQKQLRTELSEAISEAKQIVTKAVREEATKALQEAISKSLPEIPFS